MGAGSTTRIRNVTAVLGPTNTGKTHLAIERMLDHETGVIGLPLRLLAREVYDKIAARVGESRVALITGEEKIKPDSAQYWVCTVEAMPQDIPVQFMAIDEIQLAADPERGHVFTERLLNARGDAETLMLGAGTMREAIADLIPGANFISRPRLSKLTYAGQKKITRLPARSAIVAFSAGDVYAIAELIRRQRGGAAVVLGALSPRTRNAQVALYQNGDVDFLVATDAVGMGLNLDVDHVAFSAVRKFDGYNHRNLTPSELGQVAGRAGRHLSDGTFGGTGDVEPFEPDMIERLESHTFDPVKTLQWRNGALEFASIDALRDSLRELPKNRRLMRARMADDVEALENLTNDRDVMGKATNVAAVRKLWDVCQIPDYRKISSQNHAELVGTVYNYLMSDAGRIDDDWFAKQVEYSDRVDGDIDTLSNRLAHIRTWTFVANRPDWLKDPEHWQGRAQEIEDNLSDALHERLTQRFVDRRTSALMKGLKDKHSLTADVSEDGQIKVEDHYVGRLAGFRFIPDTHSDSVHGKATRHAAAQVLSRELSMRARRVAAAKNDAFKLNRTAAVLWREDEIAQLTAGEDPLKPGVTLIADEQLRGADREKVLQRVTTWINDAVRERLKPLVDVGEAEDISGLAKGIAFRLSEKLGVLRREAVAEEIRSLDQTARAQLRKYGLRFGAFNIFFPVLLKPASADLLLTLWCLKFGGEHGLEAEKLPDAPRPGLTSVPFDGTIPEAFYNVYGFHACGPRAVRIDILERLADQIRPLLSWRPSEANPEPPKGATGQGAFTVTPDMMSILGCSADELGEVLRSLGFRSERRRIEKQEPETPEVAGSSNDAGDDAGNGAGSDEASATGGDAVATAEAEAGAAVASDQATAAAVDAAASDASDKDAGVAEGEGEGDAAAQTPAPAPAHEPVADVIAEREDQSAVEAPEVTASASDSLASDSSVSESTPAEAAPAEGPQETEVSGRDDAAGEAATGDGAAGDVAEDESEQFIEVWRPVRRNDGGRRSRRPRRGASARRDEQGAARPADGGEGQATAAGGAERRQNSDKSRAGGDKSRTDDDKSRHRGRKDARRRGGDRRSRDDRSKPAVHSSSPAKKKGSVDPDSPFAALGALRQSMSDTDRGSKSS